MLLMPEPSPRQMAKATAPGSQLPVISRIRTPRTISTAESTASPGGDRFFPKTILIRRLRTCAGPNSEPITTAAVPSPIEPSIGTIWARMAASVKPRSAKAKETITMARRRARGGIAPMTVSRGRMDASPAFFPRLRIQKWSGMQRNRFSAAKTR